MENWYTVERLIAFGSSLFVGVSGKLGWMSHKKQKISTRIVLETIGLGFFGGFIADNGAVLLGAESWRFMIVPFAIYSTTHILSFWDKDSGSILRELASVLLGRIAKNDNYGEQDYRDSQPTAIEDDSEDVAGDAGDGGELPR